jgi:hypothetical protein
LTVTEGSDHLGGQACPQENASEDPQGWPWDQIVLVREIRTLEYLPLKGPVKYLTPLGRSVSYAVVRKDSTEITLDKNWVYRLGRFANLLKQHADAEGFDWEVVEN